MVEVYCRLVLKLTMVGGNASIRSSEDIEKAWAKLGQKGNLYLEEMVDVGSEFAVQVVRNAKNEHWLNNHAYPPVECRYTDQGILYLAEASYDLDPTIKDLAWRYANSVSNQVRGRGLLTVEFMLRNKGDRPELLVNEICIGRPHNSHHLTVEAMKCSQFGQILRMGLKQEAGWVDFKDGVKYGGMVNLIGAKDGSKDVEGLEEIEAKTGIKAYWYGKEPRDGRKVGHLSYAGIDKSRGRDMLRKGIEMFNSFNNNLIQIHPI